MCLKEKQAKYGEKNSEHILNKFGSDFIVDTETKEFGVASILLQKYYAQKIMVGFRTSILRMFAINVYRPRGIYRVNATYLHK